MGWTSEMLAIDYDVSRAKQDEYGLTSHNRASAAQQAGKFDGEILRIETSVLSDPKDPNSERTKVVADKDDGIRHGQTLEKMKAGKPAFKDFGLEVLAKHVTTSVVGVSPRVMGIGPVAAIPWVKERPGCTGCHMAHHVVLFSTTHRKALERAGIKQDDVDLWEVRPMAIE
jgi:acetyl-CoA acyltransferase 1